MKSKYILFAFALTYAFIFFYWIKYDQEIIISSIERIADYKSKPELAELHRDLVIKNFIEKNKKDLEKFHVNSGYLDPNAYIAHGGGVNQYYTNSLEVVCDSLSKGFKFIELDLIKTSDGHLIAAHGWNLFKKLTNFPDSSDKPLSLKEVKSLKINETLTPLDEESICKILKENPDFFLVTDWIQDAKFLLSKIPFPDRIIMEVYSFNALFNAIQAGIKFPAYNLKNLDDIKITYKYNLPLVTMQAHFFFNNNALLSKVQKLHDNGVTILLYGHKNLNSPEFIKNYNGKTVSKIYSDVWSPATLSEIK